MSDLPNPKLFAGHKAELVNPIKEKAKPSYDLHAIHERFKTAKKRADKELLDSLGNDLINWHFWRSCPNCNAAVDLFGYSEQHRSLTVSLHDKAGTLQTVAIRQAGETKWKTFGSKNYIPYRIDNSDFLFFASGMAETLIFEMLDIPYIAIQSDSIRIPDEIARLTDNKIVIILMDNDQSFKEMVQRLPFKTIVLIDFEKLLDCDLSKGYDFRDFVNEIKDAGHVMALIEQAVQNAA